ncbi:MAG: hypothetical protein M3373_13330 [Gemmatimonadota bacterium]|nr:hypothetical protein [Gemmatimonadota bacterium]
MKDTSAEVDRRFRELILARSPAERLRMGCRMFDAAREMVLASFPRNLSPDETRRRLFARLYPELTLDRIPRELRPPRSG